MPDFAKAHENLGISLCDQGELEKGIAEHRTAIRLMPDYDAAHSNLARVLIEAGKLEEGIVECRTAIRLRPDYIQAHENLITAFGLLGNFPNLSPSTVRPTG